MGATLGVIANLTFWFCMFLVQTWEVRTERVPPSRPHDKKRFWEGFLHMQDYHTTSWGDLLSLSLLDALVASKLEQGLFSFTEILVTAAFGLLIGLYFHRKEWMGPYHKPDWAYPAKGKVSWGGKLHVMYFSLQVAVVLGLGWFLVTGNLSLPQILFFFAVLGVYGVAVLLDNLSKRHSKTPPRMG